MSIQRSRVSIGWIMPLYWQDLSTLHKMYGYDTSRELRVTSDQWPNANCPVCYCMVQERFMSMHIMWHQEPDEEEDRHAQRVPIGQIKYEF